VNRYDEAASNRCMGVPSQVGSYLSDASSYSALDMLGNVWEWVNDWYQVDYYSVSPKSNPPGPAAGSNKVFRGGGWYSDWVNLRVADRLGDYPPDLHGSAVGFRCAVSAEP
jgi:formylglycine-generating enzyme required for sulfatase activity